MWVSLTLRQTTSAAVVLGRIAGDTFSSRRRQFGEKVWSKPNHAVRLFEFSKSYHSSFKNISELENHQFQFFEKKIRIKAPSVLIISKPLKNLWFS